MEESDEKLNESKEPIKEPMSQFILDKIECYKNIVLKLKKLLIIIKGHQVNNENKENVLEYLKFPHLFPFDKFKDEINLIFSVKSNYELYNYLISELKYLFNEDKTNKKKDEENVLRINFYKVLETLSYYIAKSLIFIDDKNQKDEAFEIFKKLIKSNINSKFILSSYINIFDLFSLLKDYYLTNRQDIFSIPGTKKILYLIDILRLQNVFTLKYIFNKKKLLILNINSLIFELYLTYNASLKELNNISNFIMQYKKNSITSSIINKILNEKEIKKNTDDKFKSFIIENLMINYSANNDIKNKNNTKEILIYFNIIINNNTILTKDYVIDWNILNKIIEKSLNEKDYDKIIEFLSNIKANNYIFTYLNHDSLTTLIKSVAIEKLLLFSGLIKNNKDWIQFILNNNTKKNGIKLIKSLQLKEGEYDKIYDEIAMINFFYYKVYECFENSFDILCDFALINTETFNTCFKVIIKYINKMNSDKETKEIENDNTLPLDEEAEEKIIENNNKEKKDINNKDIKTIKEEYINNTENIIYFFMNQNKIRIRKEKVLTLIHLAKLKGYDLSEINQKIFDKEFKDYYISNIDYNKYIPEDKCEPHDSTCVHINLKTTKIVFVDTAEILKENIKYFRRSKYVGIDSEWSSIPLTVNNQESASILQISNYIETRVLIIDLIKMKNDKEFFNLFKTNLSNKIFIGYDFNKNDIEQFFDEMQIMFKDAEIIDLIDMFQNKYIEKASSLKNMYEKLLEKKMCKYEQCSNWENRPLKQSQLHYAAYDAIVCVSLFKALKNTK